MSPYEALAASRYVRSVLIVQHVDGLVILHDDAISPAAAALMASLLRRPAPPRLGPNAEGRFSA